MADHIEAARSSRLAQPSVPTNMDDKHVGTEFYGSPLLWLPCELLVHAASYLSSEDLFNLRLTCRRVETFLYDTFSEEFFSDRRFMVTQYSLECLVNISKHHHLSKRISKLTIGLDRLYSSDALAGHGGRNRNINNFPVKDGINPYKLQDLAAEQSWLISSGQLQLFLGEALGNLPNVTELGIRDVNVAKGFCRPGSNKLFVSYGVAEVRRQTGVDLLDDNSHLHLQDQFADIIFTAALLAVVRTGKRLDRITVDIQKRETGLSSTAFHTPSSLIEPLRFTLQNLRSLDLSVSFTYVSLGNYSNGSLAFLPWQPHYLFKLLEYTPNLVRLRVVSKGDSFLKDEIIGWLAQLVDSSSGMHVESSRPHCLHTSLNHLTLAQRYQTLQYLELENMLAPATSLSKVLLHLTGSLRTLCLSMVGVSISQDDDELDNNPQSPNAWTSIFREMSKSVSLENLHISSLGHHIPSRLANDNRHQVAFLNSGFGVQSGPRNGLLNTWSHEGSAPSMKNFLLEIAEKTVIICTSCKQRNSGYWSFEDIFQE
nr:putative f-box-like protein [Hypoxylon sp. CO27-5]